MKLKGIHSYRFNQTWGTLNILLEVPCADDRDLPYSHNFAKKDKSLCTVLKSCLFGAFQVPFSASGPPVKMAHQNSALTVLSLKYTHLRCWHWANNRKCLSLTLSPIEWHSPDQLNMVGDNCICSYHRQCLQVVLFIPEFSAGNRQIDRLNMYIALYLTAIL